MLGIPPELLFSYFFLIIDQFLFFPIYWFTVTLQQLRTVNMVANQCADCWLLQWKVQLPSKWQCFFLLSLTFTFCHYCKFPTLQLVNLASCVIATSKTCNARIRIAVWHWFLIYSSWTPHEQLINCIVPSFSYIQDYCLRSTPFLASCWVLSS